MPDSLPMTASASPESHQDEGATAPSTRRRFIVSGMVQGVGFRWFAQRWGERLSLRGWVRNLQDGTVAAEAQGNTAAVAEFERRLRAGPPGGRVDSVETQVLKPEEGPPLFDIL